MKKLLILSSLVILCACGNSPEPQPQPEPQPTLVTDKVTFFNAELTGDLTGGNHQKFIDWFNASSNTLTDFEMTGYCQMFKNDSIVPMTVLEIGSKSSNGELILHFSKNITKLKITSQAYYKSYIDYKDHTTVIYSVDENSELYINEDSNKITLPSNDSSEPEIVVNEYTFANTNSIKFYNKEVKSRAFIREIEISYFR